MSRSQRIAILALVLGLPAGCASTAPSLPPAPLTERIVVMQRDWHTDLCLDPRSLTGTAATLVATFPDARFLCFGFGERHYMLERDHSTAAMLGSLLPSEAVLLVTPLAGPPAEVVRGPEVVDIETLRVSRAGLASFSDFLWRSLRTDANGGAEPLGMGSDPGAMFFAERGSYSAMATCNTWTAAGLRSAGLPVNDAVIFVDDVMSQVRTLAKAQAAAPP